MRSHGYTLWKVSNDVLLALGRENSYTHYNGMQNVTTTTYASNVNNVLMGGEGDDFYLIQNANTAIDDSAGADTVYLMGSGALDAIALAAINKVRLADGDSNLMTAVSTAAALDATGNALANTIIGNGNNNYLFGLDGNDTLMGGDGNDTLKGGDGNDTLTGGDGNDMLVGGAGKDSLVGGAGNDVYEIDAGDVVTELADGGNDLIRSATLTTFAGYANIEGLEYIGTNGVLLQKGTSNITTEIFIGGAGNDKINGWGGNDDLSGGAGNDSIDGGDGNDYLQGGAGADTVMGGSGNDTIFGFDDSVPNTNSYPVVQTVDLANKLYGGGGNDKITAGNGADLLYGEDGNDTLNGGLGADTIDGGAGNDMLYASTNYYDNSDLSANVLNGGAGNDTLYGSGGKDKLSGDAGADDLNGGAGNDSLSGNDGDDRLFGDDGNDILNGGAGNDTIYGGNGDDILYAGSATYSSMYGNGGDRLTGDFSYNGSGQLTGKDLFRFEATAAFAAQSMNNGSLYDPVTMSYVPLTKDMFAIGHFIDDFSQSEDKIQFAKEMVGDGDALLENVALKAGAGGTFAQSAEMVIVQADLTSDFSVVYTNGSDWNDIDGAGVVAAIGKADAAYAMGDERLFVVDDGYSSALFQFVSAGADATVSVSELKLIGIVDGQAALSASDFGLY
jgi:Ca2+-binding RTX toxin-like protein